MSPSTRISETIVPWTFLWLWYFEEWLASDVWKGGGVHPSRVERTGSDVMAMAETTRADRYGSSGKLAATLPKVRRASPYRCETGS